MSQRDKNETRQFECPTEVYVKVGEKSLKSILVSCLSMMCELSVINDNH